MTGLHRGNFGDGFENIFRALRELSERHAEIEILYLVHLNPNVREPMRASWVKSHGYILSSPVDYLPIVYLMQRAYLIITDSGGIEEEARLSVSPSRSYVKLPSGRRRGKRER